MAKKRKAKFAGKLPVWISDKALHALAKRHAKAEKRSLSDLTEQALRNYLARMTVLNEIDKHVPGNETLTLLARQKIAGTDMSGRGIVTAETQFLPDAVIGIHASVVTDQPGCPVAAPCVLEGCRYKDLDGLAESFAGGDKAVVAAAERLVQRRALERAFNATPEELGRAAVRHATNEKVRASGKRMLKKHAKTFEKLAASDVAKALGAVPAAKVKRGAHKGAVPNAETFGPPINSTVETCRRTECRHARDVHSATKSGQLRCWIAGCNCARYME